MSRRQRIHVPRGTYYVVQQGGVHQPVFSQADDYVLFERLLATALRRTGTLLHAYCWTPDAIHLVLRIDHVSIGRFMQGLTSRYARLIHRRNGDSGHFFGTRYKAALIDANAYLSKLICYVHHVPVLAGLASDLDAYPYTSHRAYAGAVDAPWVSRRTPLRALDGDPVAECGYHESMLLAPSPHDVDLFGNRGQNEWRVIGTPEFLANLPRQARTYRSKLSLDQIIASVTRALGHERDHVMSSSRKRDLALARALIAWYAVERHVATLSEVARRLNRDPSTLSVAISRYRISRPDLFKLNALHYLTPVGAQEVSSGRRTADSEEASTQRGWFDSG